MPKINFNVPLLNENGEPVTQFKIDTTKKPTVDDKGNIMHAIAVDSDGSPIKEPILMSKTLASLVNTRFKDEEALSYEDGVKRGKLVRKLSDASKGSLKNYSSEEIVTIKNLLVKAQATPLLAIQFEEIAEGEVVAEVVAGE